MHVAMHERSICYRCVCVRVYECVCVRECHHCGSLLYPADWAGAEALTKASLPTHTHAHRHTHTHTHFSNENSKWRWTVTVSKVHYQMI